MGGLGRALGGAEAAVRGCTARALLRDRALRPHCRRLPHRAVGARATSSTDSASGQEGRTAPTTPFHVATPIFYVNSVPHIGHQYTCVLADAAARWHAMARPGERAGTLLSTGTDEHGSKVKEAAAAAGLAPPELCGTMAERFRALCDQSGVAYQRFVRTSTDADHRAAVEALWRKVRDSGHLYKDAYAGWYCTSDETFLTKSQVSGRTGHKRSIETGHPVTWMDETNYFLRLSAFLPAVRGWVDRAVFPKSRRRELHTMLDQGLPDLSVSRSRQSLDWGIPVPDDPDQTIYVWMDALANYLTVHGYPGTEGQCDLHVIGKDIIKFHCIYWPALCLAADLPLPSSVVVHGHWTSERYKMSKSLGNVVDPFALLDEFGVNNVRYFLLRDSRLSTDADYTKGRVVAAAAELTFVLGNLMSRSTGAKLNQSGEFPGRNDVVLDRDSARLCDSIAALPAAVRPHYDRAEFGLGMLVVFDALREVNRYFDAQAPWRLVKTGTEEDTARCRTVLHTTLEALRVAAVLLRPCIPKVAEQLLWHLGIDADKQTLEDCRVPHHLTTSIRPLKEPLLPRVLRPEPKQPTP